LPVILVAGGGFSALDKAPLPNATELANAPEMKCLRFIGLEDLFVRASEQLGVRARYCHHIPR
jgi:hypothetical protein